MVDLKNCPFCGSPATRNQLTTGHAVVTCEACQCHGPRRCDDAIAAWNRRAALPKLDWQPIATAPRSFSIPVDSGHYVKRIYLLGYLKSCISVIWWEPHHHAENRGAWVNDSGREVNPTMWQPLPSPPTS